MRKAWEIIRVPLLLLLAFFLSALVTSEVMGRRSKERFVPSVIGLPLEEGISRLKSYGFKAKVVGREPSRWIPEGFISGQDPEKGRLRIGETIYLKLSTGKPFVKVPSLKGMKLGEAVKRIQDLKLEVGEVVRAYSGWARRGVVLAQDPEPGSAIREGSSLKLLVSRGMYPPTWW